MGHFPVPELEGGGGAVAGLGEGLPVLVGLGGVAAHHADPVHAVQVLPERRPGQVLGDGVQARHEDAEPGRGLVLRRVQRSTFTVLVDLEFREG